MRRAEAESVRRERWAMSDGEGHDITDMLPRMRAGDEAAAELLWQHYYRQLVHFARRRLEGVPRGAVDEEDVALSALFSFCRGMEEGRFAAVGDRDDLWKLLVTITARKACAKRRHEYADKRDARRVRGGGPRRDSSDERLHELDHLAAVTPAAADDVVDNCRKLLGCLDEKSRQIAVWRLQGYSKAEIAEKLGCVRRTVERKLERIREKWSRLGFAPKPAD